MRKFIYWLYAMMTSYLVLGAMLSAICCMWFFSRTVERTTDELNNLLQMNLDMETELKRLQEKASGMAQLDLEKRFELVKENFVKRSDLLELDSSSDMGETLGSLGWKLSTEEDWQLKQENEFLGIGLATRLVYAELATTDTEEKPPLVSLLPALEELWRKPPTKDFRQFSVTRIPGGFGLELEILMPFTLSRETGDDS